MFFVATFLVILVTLECHGEQDIRDNISSWIRSTNAPTTADPNVVRFPPRQSQSQNILKQVLRDSEIQVSQSQNAQTQRPQSSNCNCCNCNQEVSPSVQESSTPVPSDGSIQTDTDAVADPAQVINNQLRQFGLKLLIELSQLDKTSNLILSPFSLWSLLLVILEGASGSTAEQIRNTLHLPPDRPKIRSNYKFIESGLVAAKGSADVDAVNALFFDKHRPLNDEFQHVAEQSYHAEVHHVDFSNPTSTANQINKWVANKTHNRITRLVQRDDLTRPQLLVTNAIYFKGMWEMPFNSTATKKAKFYNEENVHIANVDMMYQKGMYMHSFITEINSLVLDMPYSDHKFRMLFVLPQQGNNLLNVYRAMQNFPVNECYNRLLEEQALYSDSEIPIYVPRFKIKYDRTYNRILQNLGIEDLFKPDSANLSRMTNSKVYLNKLIHIAEIEVNERGTTASAASGAMFVNKVSPPKFLANRPFAFFIVENSRKTVLFAGRVMNPNKID